MSSGPRILERARGKARASIITAAINYSVPEPQGPQAALRGADADIVYQLLRLGEERNMPRVTQGVSV